METNFEDNFSKQSDTYRKYRPTYPVELFRYLSSLTESHDLAWDCGTGNGQAAISLTGFYRTVIATDPSEQQINNALPHPQVIYKVEKAESSSLRNHSVDLVTIAQAIHWFHFDSFYAEVKRVAKQNGIIAAWAYGLPSISTEVDKSIRHFHDHVIGHFWQAGNRLISKKYTTIPFPFELIEPPPFAIQQELSLTELIGHISSWSAIQKFIDTSGYNPVGELEEELVKQWPDKEDKKLVTWKLNVKVGRNS